MLIELLTLKNSRLCFEINVREYWRGNPEKLSTWVKTMNKKYSKMITETSKQYAFLSENYSKIDQEMTSV